MQPRRPGTDPGPSVEEPWSSTRWFVIVALAALLVAVIFGGTVTDSFLSDDFNIIRGLSEEGTLSRWASEGQPFFRPLVVWSYSLDLRLWGPDSRGFHISNLLLHLLSALGVAVILGQMARRGTALGVAERREMALAGGALFLAHPSHMEPVAWIASRGDLLATALALACFIGHGRWRETGRVAWRWVSILAAVGALCSKEAAASLPVALFVFDFFLQRGEPWRRRLVVAFSGVWPFLLALPLYIGFRGWVLGQIIGGYGTDMHFKADPALLLDHLFSYLSRSVIPRVAGEQLPAGTVAVLVGLVVAGVLWRPQAKVERTGLGWLLSCSFVVFAILTLPALSLPVSTMTTVAERFIYLPSTFAIILAVAALRLIFPSGRRFRLVVCGLVTIFSVQVMVANRPWRQASEATQTIVAAVLEKEPVGKTYLLGVPDNIRGGFVFRNGIQAALWMAGYKRPEKVLILNWVELPDLSYRVKSVHRGRTVVVQAPDRNPRFRFRVPGRGIAGIKVEAAGRYRNRFRIPKLRKRDRLLLFNGGEMTVLQPGRLLREQTDSGSQP